MPVHSGERRACRCVPYARRLVVGRGDDAGAVRAERRGGDIIAVPLERGEQRTGLRVPDDGGLVFRGGDDARTIRAERRGGDAGSMSRASPGGSPVSASQMRAVPSFEAVTMWAPSGLNAADVTVSPCPSSSMRTVPVLASQIRAVLSFEAVTIRTPSGLNAAEVTAPRCPLREMRSRSRSRAVFSASIVRLVCGRRASPTRGQAASASRTASTGWPRSRASLENVASEIDSFRNAANSLRRAGLPPCDQGGCERNSRQDARRHQPDSRSASDLAALRAPGSAFRSLARDRLPGRLDRRA